VSARRSFASAGRPYLCRLGTLEIQGRQRRNEISNLGTDNIEESPSLKYKRAFFVDWRAGDRLKRELLPKAHFFLDTNRSHAKARGWRLRASGHQDSRESALPRGALLRPRPVGRALDGRGMQPAEGRTESCLVFRLRSRRKQLASWVWRSAN